MKTFEKIYLIWRSNRRRKFKILPIERNTIVRSIEELRVVNGPVKNSLELKVLNKLYYCGRTMPHRHNEITRLETGKILVAGIIRTVSSAQLFDVLVATKTRRTPLQCRIPFYVSETQSIPLVDYQDSKLFRWLGRRPFVYNLEISQWLLQSMAC